VNFLFGLIPLMPLIILLLLLVQYKVLSSGLARVVFSAAFVIACFYSFNTYGPRNKLETAILPSAPEINVIAIGTELIPQEEKITFNP